MRRDSREIEEEDKNITALFTSNGGGGGGTKAKSFSNVKNVS